MQSSTARTTRDRNDGILMARFLVSMFRLPAVRSVAPLWICREPVAEAVKPRDNRVAPTSHRGPIGQNFLRAAKPCVLEHREHNIIRIRRFGARQIWLF